jgi:hypothetical protein
VERLKNSSTWKKFSGSGAGAVILAILAALIWPFLWLWRRLFGRHDQQGGGQGPDSGPQGEGEEPGPQGDDQPGQGPSSGPDTDEGAGSLDPKPETTHSGEMPRTTTNGRNTVSANPLLIATSELQSSVAAHVPEDMWQVQMELRQLPQVMENVALAFRSYTQRLHDNYPIDPAVTERMFELFQQIGQCASPAGEVGNVFENVHSEEIKRREAPRPGEAAWNV